MDRKPIVYIVNDAYQHDYSKARRFGELIAITKGNVNVFKIPRLIWTVREALKDFSPQDYILLSGTGILHFLTITEALRHSDSVNVLQFGAKTEDYVLGTIQKEFWPGLFSGEEAHDREAIRGDGWKTRKANKSVS